MLLHKSLRVQNVRTHIFEWRRHGARHIYLLVLYAIKVTFMLLDQDNVGHEEKATSPVPTFCSIEELNNHAYVRDDTMFFKIIVDTIIILIIIIIV